MNERDATVSYQPPLSIRDLSPGQYGPSSLTQFQGAGIGTFLSQGLAIGAIIFFLISMVVTANPYNGDNSRYLFFLLGTLAWGMGIGLVQGLVIWVCTRLVGHDLSRVARATIGALVLAIPWGTIVSVVAIMYSGRISPELVELCFPYFCMIGALGATYGLFIGSRLRLWPELVRGTASMPGQSSRMTGFTGVVLRVAIVFLLMESILFFSTSVTAVPQRDFIFAVFAVVHFIAAFVLVFVRLRFWLLLQLALIINFPIVALMAEVVQEDRSFMWYAGVGYLGAWAAFLISRAPGLHGSRPN